MKYILGSIISYTLFVLLMFGIACNNPSTQTPPYFGATLQATSKPVRDTVKGVILDHYQRSVTTSWDSIVVVGIASASPPPVDTVVTPPSTNYGTLIYSSGYNSIADLDPFKNNQYGNGYISATIYKDGPGSFKSVPANVSAGIRSEVQYPDNLTPTEGAIEYDVRYETVFQNSGHSLQFHPNTSGGSASPGLWHVNGQFVWVNWKGGTNTKYPTNFTIPKDKWIHCVFQYKFGSSGYMKFTIDGVVVLNAVNIQVNDNSGAYLKVGVNMWVNQSSVVYYDNLKIWKK